MLGCLSRYAHLVCARKELSQIAHPPEREDNYYLADPLTENLGIHLSYQFNTRTFLYLTLLVFRAQNRYNQLTSATAPSTPRLTHYVRMRIHTTISASAAGFRLPLICL